MAVVLSTDHNVNRIALCSAIFAGFAYVGYSVVKSAFCRRKRHSHQSGPNTRKEDEHRMVFRRFSQTTQTDVMLGDLDMSNLEKITFRPLSVQERIRELNVKAHQFADAVLAISSNGGSPKHTGCGARSLQPSPWSSPRILSPVDVRHFAHSHSSENLAFRDGETPVGSPIRQRWNRRSLKTKKVELPPQVEQDEEKKETLNIEEEERLKASVSKLDGQGGTLSSTEAEALVSLLSSKDLASVTRCLITISNCAAFTASQNALREAGCLSRLQQLLVHSSTDVQKAATQAISNLALNEENIKELKLGATVLSIMIQRASLDDDLLMNWLVTLTNIAVFPIWHKEIILCIPRLHFLMDTVVQGGRYFPTALQTCKLLVNLSCNDELVPFLLAAQAPVKLIYIVDMNTPDELMLRVMTWLANVAVVTKRLGIEPMDLPAFDKAPAPDTFYAALFGVAQRERLLWKTDLITIEHSVEDIRFQAKRFYDAVKEEP